MNTYSIEKPNSLLKETGMEFFPLNSQPNVMEPLPHIHEAIEIIWITEGTFQVHINNRQYHCAPGDLVLFRSNTIHFITTDSQPIHKYYVLKVRPELFFELASQNNAIDYILRFALTSDNSKTIWSGDSPLASDIAVLFHKIIAESSTPTPCQDLAMKLYAGQILMHLLRDIIKNESTSQPLVSSHAAPEVYRAIQFINEHYAEDIDARLCAKQMSLSYSYFSRSFNNITGKSFREYLNGVRINHAQLLLATTSLSVTQVAMECGYNNVSYFISVYKAITGQTPLRSR